MSGEVAAVVLVRAVVAGPVLRLRLRLRLPLLDQAQALLLPVVPLCLLLLLCKFSQYKSFFLDTVVFKLLVLVSKKNTFYS